MKRRKFFSQIFKAAVAVAMVPFAAVKAKPWIYDIWWVERQKRLFFYWTRPTYEIATAKKWLAMGIEFVGCETDALGEVFYIFRQKIYLSPKAVASMDPKDQKDILWEYHPVLCGLS